MVTVVQYLRATLNWPRSCDRLPAMAKTDDDKEMEALQVALVRFQQRAIETGERDLVIFEGRSNSEVLATLGRPRHIVRNGRLIDAAPPSCRELSP